MARRRLPIDQLPGLGEWDGPIYGQLGVLTVDDELVQCHACARWFGNLGTHVRKTHGLHPDEYRAFGGGRRGGGAPENGNSAGPIRERRLSVTDAAEG